MKKVLFALAIAGMFGFAACNNNNNATEEEATVDTMATVEAVATECEATVEENDSTLVQEVAADVIDAVAEELTK